MASRTVSSSVPVLPAVPAIRCHIGDGFTVGSVHAIMNDVPPENIVPMTEVPPVSRSSRRLERRHHQTGVPLLESSGIDPRLGDTVETLAGNSLRRIPSR
jgi:hypothetical protein